jgi:hypothetical protein
MNGEHETIWKETVVAKWRLHSPLNMHAEF